MVEEKSEQEVPSLKKKLHQENEQEIIEEIMEDWVDKYDLRVSDNPSWDELTDLTKSPLQKGKAIGHLQKCDTAKKTVELIEHGKSQASKIAELNTENFNLKDWIKQYDNQAKEYRSRIAELEKEYLHALECMDRICKRCQDNLERLRR